MIGGRDAGNQSKSSRWIHEELLRGSIGQGAFTFAAPDLKAVRTYILNQEEHHRVKTFHQEYVPMLNRGIEAYEERSL